MDKHLAAAVKQRLPAISVLYQKMHYLHFLKQDWDFYREPAEPRDLQD
jgi:hypothetical protein